MVLYRFQRHNKLKSGIIYKNFIWFLVRNIYFTMVHNNSFFPFHHNLIKLNCKKIADLQSFQLENRPPPPLLSCFLLQLSNWNHSKSDKEKSTSIRHLFSKHLLYPFPTSSSSSSPPLRQHFLSQPTSIHLLIFTAAALQQQISFLSSGLSLNSIIASAGGKERRSFWWQIRTTLCSSVIFNFPVFFTAPSFAPPQLH